MLHITNGDAVAQKLEEAGVGGEVSISADLLHEGPCPTAAGASDMMTAFRSTQEMEERVFLGDLPFAHAVRRLAEAGLPLVRLDAPGLHVPPARRSVSLTPLGREVLAGRADYAALNGLDRRIGGVHLRGRMPAWRWDMEGGALVRRGLADTAK